MVVVDRVVAAIGGRALVTGRPGMGWLVFEVSPAFVWTQITGAMSMEFYYFIAYLTMLGATDADLALLPLMCSAAGVGQAVIVLSRGPGNVKRRCVADCLWARCLWLGTVLVPLVGWWAGWSTSAILAGVFASVFATHLIGQASSIVWMTWTQALVPRELRGVFYAWRNIHSYVVVALVLLAVAELSPSGLDASGRLLWLTWLLGGATVIGIAGTWWLALAPGVPPGAEATVYHPLLPRLRASAPLLRHVAWLCLTAVAITCSGAYQSKLYLEAGTVPERMAWWQAVSFYPLMLIAILATGWALPRLHARPLLLAAHVVTILAEAALLVLAPTNLAWMLPTVLAVFGVAKGVWSIAWISRLQEILPPGDPRFASLLIGVSSLAGLGVTFGLPRAIAAIETALAAHAAPVTVAWILVAFGVGVRLLATPLLMWPDRARVTAVEGAAAA